MTKKSKMFVYSLITTVLMIIWSFFLPNWNSKEWFVESWIHNMWIGFDIILSILLIALTFGIYSKRKYVRFLSPTIFGMIITDWIFNIQLWIFGGFNLLETRFIFSYILVAVVILYFFWFARKIHEESINWS